MKIFVLGLLLFTSSVQAKILPFLYINASEGNASGGHVAVQLDDDVYDYQYQNGLIRLFKHPADVFKEQYQLQQNRSIYAADIEVSDTAYQQINQYVKKQYFQQSQALKQQHAAQHNQALLQALLQHKINKTVNPENLPQLSGAGLFYSTKTITGIKTTAPCQTAQSSIFILGKVRRRLENEYGKSFLTQKILNLNKTLNRLVPTVIAEVTSDPYAYAERYTDIMNGILALQTLQKNKPLTDNACFHIDLTNAQLNATDIAQAKILQQKLFHSAHALVVSKRSDWAHALLIILARLIVIEQSIQSGYWTFLDDSDDTSPFISSQKLSLYGQAIKDQRLNDIYHFYHTLAALKTHTLADENYYVQLEMTANRYQQWLESDITGLLRYKSERTLPQKNISLLPFLFTELSTTQLSVALNKQKIATERLISTDINKNTYHIFSKNCVTALFELLNAATSGQSKPLLGDFINPKTTFIPFQAFDKVKQNYKITKTRELQAYRHQKLLTMYYQEVDGWVYARESNIFSSSLYHYNPDDAWFVFFTDDSLALRPLFGAINTLSAASQGLYGLIRWPFDEGKTLKIAAKGLIASLPELMFFNIRKGSYPYPLEP